VYHIAATIRISSSYGWPGRAFRAIPIEQVKTIGGIQRTHSIIALSTIKEMQTIDTSAVAGREGLMLEALMAHVWLVVKGAGIGFAVAAPVGPIGMLCIRTSWSAAGSRASPRA